MTESDFLAVFDHEEIRARLGRAIEQGRLPQSLLLYGPHGVGKQRLALWTAAAIACQGNGSRPCGACKSCRLASRLQHPDIHWFFPLPRPKRAGGPEQLQQKLEDLRAKALEDRRQNAFYLDEEEGATGIYVAAVQTMRTLAHKAPAMGQAKVLIIGQAEALVPQASSPEAANALLKLLEEPPADTTLIMTSDTPGALLPTVRSRLQAVRVPPLPNEMVADFLATRLSLNPEDAQHVASRSGGSIGRALQLKDAEGEDLQELARDLVAAILDGSLGARLAAAHRYRPFGARGTFTRVLEEARSLLRDLLAEVSGASAADPAAIRPLHAYLNLDPADLIDALEAIDRARELADRNVNPQLILVNAVGGPAARNRRTTAPRSNSSYRR
ncbi:MAG: AAA family ATPase [Gemmatimonadota bacterium]|nr:MAG: AAA family ATPase [Gemmatimonadota bacterium]